ncbi:2065_t:CDS:2, partial [Cetraspora pellucida]
IKHHKMHIQKYEINKAQTIINDTDSEATMQKCQEKRFYIHKNDNNRSLNYASSSVSIVSKFSTNNKPLDNFAYHQFTESNFDKFNYLLLKATISNRWSFHYIQNSDTIILFEFINPSCDKILSYVSNQMVANIKNKAQKDFYSIILTMDVIDISNKRACIEEVKNKINEITKSVTNEGIKVTAIVTDSHSSYAAARKQLQVKNPQITYLSCFAHQTNLYIGEIFKESNIFKTTALETTHIAIYFKNKQHAYFTGKLCDI